MDVINIMPVAAWVKGPAVFKYIKPTVFINLDFQYVEAIL